MSTLIYTYDEAKSKLDEANDALSKVLKSQEYRHSDLTQRRALLSEVQNLVFKWEEIISEHIRRNPSLREDLIEANKSARKGPKVFYHGAS